jgi:hypothetical protein
VRFSMRQHARAKSISKRARSTTPTSLRFRINELRTARKSGAQNPPSNLAEHRSSSKSALYEDALFDPRRELCQTSQCRSITYADFFVSRAPTRARPNDGRGGGRRRSEADRPESKSASSAAKRPQSSMTRPHCPACGAHAQGIDLKPTVVTTTTGRIFVSNQCRRVA